MKTIKPIIKPAKPATYKQAGVDINLTSFGYFQISAI